jgi:DNA-binding transcriptional ArsR family regulator
MYNCTMMQIKASEAVAGLLAALGSEPRLRIVELLRAGERCVCEITPAFDLDPSVVSRHLTILEHAGVISSRRDGRRIYYQITDRRLLPMLDAAQQIADHPEQARPVKARNGVRRRAC